MRLLFLVSTGFLETPFTERAILAEGFILDGTCFTSSYIDDPKGAA